MWNITPLIQVKAFARQYGLFMAGLWIASFLSIMLMPGTPLGNLLALATPFLMGYLLIRFRNYALNGEISFRRGLALSVYTFFYASLIFAVFQYVYFRYLDNGAMMNMLLSSMKMLEPVYTANGMSKHELDMGLAAIQQLSPIELAFVFLMQNLFFGVLISFPVALVCRRKAASHGYDR